MWQMQLQIWKIVLYPLGFKLGSFGFRDQCSTEWAKGDSIWVGQKPVTYNIYTHRQKLSNTTFFGDTVFEVPERNMWVIEIKYFEFYCKFYYFYEHLELKMILLTKYLDNLRPFTKQVKNYKGKHWKKFEADVWKISFVLTFNKMESYYLEHQLVYYMYKFLKKLFLWRA